jgi:hypothetical protein
VGRVVLATSAMLPEASGMKKPMHQAVPSGSVPWYRHVAEPSGGRGPLGYHLKAEMKADCEQLLYNTRRVSLTELEFVAAPMGAGAGAGGVGGPCGPGDTAVGSGCIGANEKGRHAFTVITIEACPSAQRQSCVCAQRGSRDAQYCLATAPLTT